MKKIYECKVDLPRMEGCFTPHGKFKQMKIENLIIEEELRCWCVDGRPIGLLAEPMCARLTNGKKMDKGWAYDVDDGKKVEVRTVTGEFNLASASEKGVKRKVTPEGLEKKLEMVDYYIAVNFNPKMDVLFFYKITKGDINLWKKRGWVNQKGAITRKRFFDYWQSMNPNLNEAGY
jgi:hypothetical protein